jgi:hypothetical protein
MRDRLTLLLLGVAAVALVGMCFMAREAGAIAVATPGAQLQLKSAFGSHVSLPSGSEPMAVAARAYQPVALTLSRNQDGDTWTASSRGPWGKLARIGVERGRTTAIEVGPPFSIKPEVAIRPGEVRVSLGLFGRAGEKYENVILRNNQRIPGPQVKIVDDAGTVLSSGQFQYG